MWQNIASRSFGSNQVLFGGMIPPPSATVINSSMLVGNIENAHAYWPLLTSFSSSGVPRMPPTKWMRLLVRGSSTPNNGARTYFCSNVASSFSIESVVAALAALRT